MALGLLVPTLSLAATVRVAGAQLNTDAARTELVLSLSAATEHSLFTLTHPDRIVIDVDGATLTTVLPAGQGVVSDLRSAMHDDKLRLVLDLAGRATPRSFIRNGATGPELVIDLYPAGGAISANPPAAAAAVPMASVAVAWPATAQVAVSATSVAPTSVPAHGRDIVVAIDAGHGGRDPGAHGPHGALEKNATLAIARRLAVLVDQQPGMKAVLTRDGDVYVPLRERFQKARHAHADLFVSIHCDASRDHSADGATVYVLSEHGASSEHAKAVAARENYEELVGGVDLTAESPQVRSVLVDMSQTAAMNDSFDVGSSVARQLAAMGAMHRYSVQQAGFMVLKAPDVPSMLVETNYITNPRAAKLLMAPDYQQRLAQAMATGIGKYFERYPPAGTELAAAATQHRSGEGIVAGAVSLPMVAQTPRR
jgi:N-acetylmuramoyl-L-alanine amidase